MVTKYFPENNTVVDLSGSPYWRGNGPFAKGQMYGVALHVNVDENGTGDDFWKYNSGQVTPNFEVFKSKAAGGVHQVLPFNWQPWCQVDGNFHYTAVETAGLPGEPLTEYQIEAIGKIVAIYHRDYGVPLAIADHPGQRGLITHAAGGLAWGGHSCPGTIRTHQRPEILEAARHYLGTPTPHKPGVKYIRHKWPLPTTSFQAFGPITGPANVHGGVNAQEQEWVTWIQKRFQQLGYAPAYNGWADGKWEQETTQSCVAWHHDHFKEAEYPKLITRVAWNNLMFY